MVALTPDGKRLSSAKVIWAGGQADEAVQGIVQRFRVLTLESDSLSSNLDFAIFSCVALSKFLDLSVLQFLLL